MQASISGGNILLDRSASKATLSSTTDPTLIFQLHAEAPQTPLIAHFLPSQLPHVDDLPLQGIDVTPGVLGFEFSHDRIAEAFDRLQDDIKQWSSVLADSPVADSPADAPSSVQLLQPDAPGGSAAKAAGSEEGQTAASEQGSAEAADAHTDAGNEETLLQMT